MQELDILTSNVILRSKNWICQAVDSLQFELLCCRSADLPTFLLHVMGFCCRFIFFHRRSMKYLVEFAQVAYEERRLGKVWGQESEWKEKRGIISGEIKRSHLDPVCISFVCFF